MWAFPSLPLLPGKTFPQKTQTNFLFRLGKLPGVTLT
jgi:hypothetical protein